MKKRTFIVVGMYHFMKEDERFDLLQRIDDFNFEKRRSFNGRAPKIF